METMLRKEPGERLEVFDINELVLQSLGNYQATVQEGLRLLDERDAFRARAAAQTQQYRYRDMAFRVFRNDALQKYDAQFDLAARYVYLAATAYDYELNMLSADNRSPASIYEDIVRERNLGGIQNNQPVVGRFGLATELGKLS